MLAKILLFFATLSKKNMALWSAGYIIASFFALISLVAWLVATVSIGALFLLLSYFGYELKKCRGLEAATPEDIIEAAVMSVLNEKVKDPDVFPQR